MKNSKQKGGIALEYLLVSLLAFVLTSIAMGIIVKTYNAKLVQLGQEFNIKVEPLDFGGLPWDKWEFIIILSFYILPLVLAYFVLFKILLELSEQTKNLVQVRKALIFTKKTRKDVCSLVLNTKQKHSPRWCRLHIYHRKKTSWVNICKEPLYTDSALLPNRHYYLEIVCEIKKLERKVIFWQQSFKI